MGFRSDVCEEHNVPQKLTAGKKTLVKDYIDFHADCAARKQLRKFTALWGKGRFECGVRLLYKMNSNTIVAAVREWMCYRQEEAVLRSHIPVRYDNHAESVHPNYLTVLYRPPCM